jgi:hypothetical protein
MKLGIRYKLYTKFVKYKIRNLVQALHKICEIQNTEKVTWCKLYTTFVKYKIQKSNFVQALHKICKIQNTENSNLV